MWGPKQEKVRKPRVLRLYCWISSMRVSEEERISPTPFVPYHSLVPIPLHHPDTTPSSRYHSLVQIPLPRPNTTPSSRYHSLVPIPLPRPDTTPSGHTTQCPLLYASRPCSRRPTGGDVVSQVVYIFSERDTALLPLRCCCCCCYCSVALRPQKP